MRLPFISASVGVCSLSLSFFSPLFFFFFPSRLVSFFFLFFFYPGKSCPAQRFAISRRHKTIRWSFVFISRMVHMRRKGKHQRREWRYIRTYTWSTVYISVDHHWQCIVLCKWQKKKKKNIRPIYCVVYQSGKEKGNWLQLVISQRWLNIFFSSPLLRFDDTAGHDHHWYKYDMMVLVRKWHRRQMFSIVFQLIHFFIFLARCR